MELLDPQVLAVVEKIFGAAAASDFIRTLAIFSAAAWLHSRGVRKEIRTQIGDLISVFKQDHDNQQKAVAELRSDVDKIKMQLNIIIKGDL